MDNLSALIRKKTSKTHGKENFDTKLENFENPNYKSFDNIQRFIFIEQNTSVSWSPLVWAFPQILRSRKIQLKKLMVNGLTLAVKNKSVKSDQIFGK